MAFWRLVGVVMVKDLRAELRTKEAVNASLSFALVVLVLFSFAFDPDEDTMRLMSGGRSEEHTSELQSLTNLVCRLLLEKKKKMQPNATSVRHRQKKQL